MKEIELSQGKFALVDDGDFEWLNQWKWCVNETQRGRFYVARRVEKLGVGVRIYMHAAIMNPESGFEVDHKNRNPLDNRRENLRICTPSQNRMNGPARTNNKLGLKGVCKTTTSDRYFARITVNYKAIYLGCFKTPEEASIAYKLAATKMHGEFSNFG